MRNYIWKKVISPVIVLLLLTTMAPIVGQAVESSNEELTTGFEDRDGDTWTTHEEELEFLEDLATMSDRVNYSQVGTSVEGRPIHLVRVGYPEPPSDVDIAANRNVLIMGTPHGNEPAGREMTLKLMRDLAFTDDQVLLDQMSEATILFVPTPNPDGREANIRRNAMNIDNNRDHLNFNTPEIQAIAGVMEEFRPDITVDAHERGGSDPGIEFLWPRNLNVDEELRELNIEMVQDYVRPDVEEAGFTTGLYGRPGGAGGEDERILRNMGGLRHGLSMLTESGTALDPVDRVDMQMEAAESVLRFYREEFDNVEKVVNEAPERKKAEGADSSIPFYFDGADNWEPTNIMEPKTCGYILTSSQAEDVSLHIDLFSLETEAFGDDATFITMNQPRMTVVPLLFDERANFNEVDGFDLYDCSYTAENIKSLVERFEDEGAFTSEVAARALKTHMIAVDRFEKQGDTTKVVKHMNGFNLLLEHQVDNELISEQAAQILKGFSDGLTEEWITKFDSNRAMSNLWHLSVDIGPRVAGSESEREAAEFLKKEFQDLGYDVSTQDFDIRDRVKGQLQILTDDNNELPLGVARGAAETGADGITGNVYEAGLGNPEDFSEDIQGNIALIQRGDLTYWEKVENAIEAGASGVIIYDNAESYSPLAPGLGNNTSSIPVIGITKKDGEALLEKVSAEEVEVNLMVRTLTNQQSQNVIAVKKPENIENPEIVYVTAHYDSVPFSPGANDDGSGTVTILEIARNIKDLPTNKEIRFVAFGAEEIGLVGSRYYVDQLSEAEIDRSLLDFQLDMVGTNWEPASQLYISPVDGAPNLVWESSVAAAERIGIDTDILYLNAFGRSDHVPFYDAGIDSALFIWMEPGTERLEPYYHTPEDKIEHVSQEKIQLVGDLINSAVIDLMSEEVPTEQEIPDAS